MRASRSRVKGGMTGACVPVRRGAEAGDGVRRGRRAGRSGRDFFGTGETAGLTPDHALHGDGYTTNENLPERRRDVNSAEISTPLSAVEMR